MKVHDLLRPVGVVALVADSPSVVEKSPELLELAPISGAVRNSAEYGDDWVLERGPRPKLVERESLEGVP